MLKMCNERVEIPLLLLLLLLFFAGSGIVGTPGLGGESSHFNVKVIWWSEEKARSGFGTFKQSTHTLFGRTNYVSVTFFDGQQVV